MKPTNYPTCDHHEVRCPSCGRSLAAVAHKQHPLPDANLAKHCGAPCYGTAWYKHEPARHNPFIPSFKVTYAKPTKDDPLGQRTPGVGDEVQSVTTKKYDWGMSIPITREEVRRYFEAPMPLWMKKMAEGSVRGDSGIVLGNREEYEERNECKR